MTNSDSKNLGLLAGNQAAIYVVHDDHQPKDLVINKLDEFGIKTLTTDSPPDVVLAAKKAAVIVETDKEGDVDTLAVQLAEKLGVDSYVPVCATQRGLVVAKEPVIKPRPTNLDQQQLAEWEKVTARLLWEEAFVLRIDTDSNLAKLLVHKATKYPSDLAVFSQEIPVEVTLSFKLLLRAAFALGAYLASRHQAGERVGLMLPTSAGTAAVFYACAIAGVVPVMLNFSAGSSNLLSACKIAKVKTVYTAQALLDKLEVTKVAAAALAEQNIEIKLLEKVRASLSLKHKLGAVLGMVYPHWRANQLPGAHRKPSDEAVILFTSGSEGAPKGVVLTHKNLISNVSQVLTRVKVYRGDLLLNSLPVFHSFGMMGGLILPVAGGIRSLQVPSPLLFKEIPELISKHKATILFSTNTFLNQYAKFGNAENFESLSLILAGGEKLQPTVRTHWLEKMNKEIMEAYGVTETSPGVSISIKNYVKAGSIGLPLPQIKHRLVEEKDITEGKKLQISGPNVMSGYILEENPDRLVVPEDGWHDTGDIATVDDFGFLSIVGRLKRFAKIAGEMVSLTKLESVLLPVLEEGKLGAIVSIPDASRGEQIVFVTNDKKEIDKSDLTNLIQQAGLPELWVPRKIIYLEEIPLLPTGKINYPKLTDTVTKE